MSKSPPVIVSTVRLMRLYWSQPVSSCEYSTRSMPAYDYDCRVSVVLFVGRWANR